MIFVSQEEADSRLENPNNSVRIVEKIMHDSGRNPGDKNRTPEDREKIGALARLIGPSEASEMTGASVSQASNYSKGKNGYEQKDAELEEGIEKRLKPLHNLALEKLLDTLDGMDSDAIRAEKPKTQSEIARNLASIIEKTSPKQDGGVHQQVIIYSPKVDSADKYETVVLPTVVK